MIQQKPEHHESEKTRWHSDRQSQNPDRRWAQVVRSILSGHVADGDPHTGNDGERQHHS
eukprot:CAMPEP_0204355006 /NCGR_PEP_ID=MMETSP0469-20131031/33819_1 /ASSEMBLY_ACC=CAM_ASM_000384 /TAXON_ID=2969 /ORGANISM="Oxyrrhis marina" /LENGTH=58 /DNA_ID=CAMNT_0051342193 /DNA_START=115 /DNA_END=291 /DNA_ORIENTATION=+